MSGRSPGALANFGAVRGPETSPGRTTDRGSPSRRASNWTAGDPDLQRSTGSAKPVVVDTAVVAALLPRVPTGRPGADLHAATRGQERPVRGRVDGHGLRTILEPAERRLREPVAGRHEARLHQASGPATRTSSGSSTSTPASCDPALDPRSTRHGDDDAVVVAGRQRARCSSGMRGLRRTSWRLRRPRAVAPIEIGPRDAQNGGQRVVAAVLAGRLEGARALRRRWIDLAARPDRCDGGHAAPSTIAEAPSWQRLAPGALTSPIRGPDGRPPSRRAGCRDSPRRVEAGAGSPRAILSERGHPSRATA